MPRYRFTVVDDQEIYLRSMELPIGIAVRDVAKATALKFMRQPSFHCSDLESCYIRVTDEDGQEVSRVALAEAFAAEMPKRAG